MSDRRNRLLMTLAAVGLPLAVTGCGTGLPAAADGAARPALRAATAVQADPAAGEGIDLMKLAARVRAGGDTGSAIALYRQAHLRDPRDAAPLVALGDGLIEIGAHGAAAEAYGQALALEPRNPEALRGHGIARVLMAQPQFALAQFEAALAIDAGDLRAHNGKGVALDMLGDHGAAQAAYRAGLAVEPGDQKLLNNLGLSLALSGETGEAVTILERLTAGPGATALHRQNLALAYGLSGEMDRAEQLARRDLDGAALLQAPAIYVARQAEPGGAVPASSPGYLANRPSASDALPDPLAVPEATAPVAAPRQPVIEHPLPAPAATPMAAPMAAPVPAPVPVAAADPADSVAAEPPTVAAPAILPQRAAPVRNFASPPPALAAPAATALRPLPPFERVAPQAVAAAERPVLIIRSSTPAAGAAVYRVQLAAYRTAAEAEAGWTRRADAAVRLLGGLTPTVQRADLGSEKGVFFRLQAGAFANAASATELCRALLAQQVDCLVVAADPQPSDGSTAAAAAPAGELAAAATAGLPR